MSHDGVESKQIDVIVANDIGVRFDENEKTFETAESVAGAITVKSSLDRAALIDALGNLASIPEPSKEALSFKGLAGDACESFLDRHPCHYVFAYDGMDGSRSLEEVREFFRSHPEIPLRR